jgi:hypothetical protein
MLGHRQIERESTLVVFAWTLWKHHNIQSKHPYARGPEFYEVLSLRLDLALLVIISFVLL